MAHHEPSPRSAQRVGRGRNSKKVIKRHNVRKRFLKLAFQPPRRRVGIRLTLQRDSQVADVVV